MWLCTRITSLLEPVHGRLCLERGFEAVPSGLQGFTFFGPADCSFEQFLSKKLDTGEMQWSRICEAAHLQCFLMSCPGSLGTVLRAGGHSCPAGSWRWKLAQVPGVPGAVGMLTVHAEANLRAGISSIWPPSGRATCDACYHICLLEELGAPCLSSDVLQRWECSPDERRCWRASAPRETGSRSCKLEGKPYFVLAVRNRRNKNCILLTQHLQL